ncbi:MULTISPECIES: hypothetical protein [unclassified Janthinobacterium]|uniref:hypothetical protein n=1 Tax=unclassified Janthinobacterium TaxID=2610881 RepID=UPI001E62EF59|nr:MULTISPECIES: hypothetical protein [unclassified Janthinobacterium]MCC7642547.1 hypothetical protein [Janthinobacterium sp. EB271-G4-3-1]MCC7692574.1 hypothetical protein [Janthinobacterium sp. EB271-G4-3-2]
MRKLNATLSALTLSALAACSSGPPVPDWKMNAQSSVERFQAAYLSGNALVEQTEFRRARSQVAGTGKLELVARIELLRCAARVASLAFEDCAGFEALQADATDADRAYAAWLAGKAQAADVALLPEAQRAAASASSDTAAASAVTAIKDPLSRLVAAGVLLRSGRATPELLDTAVATASDQGWRRPLLAWLGVQRLRAEQAGDAQAAQRIARRMAIVEQPLAP